MESVLNLFPKDSKMKWLLSAFNVGTDRHLKFVEILRAATRLRHFRASNSNLVAVINSSLNNKIIMATPAKKACQECHRKCGRGKVTQEVLDDLERAFGELEKSTHPSLLKKYLTREVFDDLKTIQTPNGSTLLDCIRSGIVNLDSGIGVYAPDSDAYTVFDTLFNPLIEEYHMGFSKNDKHPPTAWGNLWCFENVDPTGEYVVSTRVRCARSLQDYPFNPRLTEEQYKEIEKLLSEALGELNAEHKGTFYPLSGMTKEVQQKLIDDHFLFKEGDRFLEAANSNRFWPTGRGIFHNENKTFLVWVNEEDHVRIISMEQGGDLGQVYRRLVNGVRQIEKRVKFARHPRLGNLTFCPTNLGTTIRASVHMKLPHLALDQEQLEATAKLLNLQVRGTKGEHSDAEGGVYDVSNKRRLGLTEFQVVKEMYDGVLKLIKMEKDAAKPAQAQEAQENEP